VPQTSVSPDRGGDDKVEEINGKEVEQKQGEVTPPRDETDPLKKRKVSPLNLLLKRNPEPLDQDEDCTHYR
jgi:hypothetical protein